MDGAGSTFNGFLCVCCIGLCHLIIMKKKVWKSENLTGVYLALVSFSLRLECYKAHLGEYFICQEFA